jgi:hypothetical protein
MKKTHLRVLTTFAIVSAITATSTGLLAKSVGAQTAKKKIQEKVKSNPDSPLVSQTCDCSASTLIGTMIKTKFASFPNNTDVDSLVVSGGPEIPYSLAPSGPGRHQIDFGANSIRITFKGPATYGPGAEFKFSNIAPISPPGCSGAIAKVIGATATTNKQVAASFVTANTTFTATAVTAGFQNQNLYADWQTGEYIDIRLTFGCDPVTPVASTCCPPLTGLAVRDMFTRLQSSVGSPYGDALDVAGPAFTNFVAGQQAYLGFLKFVCPAVDKLSITFTPKTANVLSGPWTGSPAGLSPFTIYIPVSGPATGTGGNFGGLFTPGPTVYGIQAEINGVTASNGPVNCGFDVKSCSATDRFTWVYNIGFKVAPAADGSVPVPPAGE